MTLPSVWTAILQHRAGDVSAFTQTGDHADAYVERLGSYGSVIMGRNTYEFGYAFGLEAGRRAYPHMDHHIFSSGIELPGSVDVTVVRKDWLDHLTRLRSKDGNPIYLCGGGVFAGWVLAQDLIDRLILKKVPITLGDGIPLFAGEPLTTAWQTQSVTPYANGVTLIEFART